jgi:DnaA family protein
VEQLLIPVTVSEHMIFESFYPGPNLEIYQSLQANIQKLLWIAGTKGSGKTHLLQAAFNRSISLSHTSLYIPMQEFNQFSPEILDDLDQMDLICIDDIEFILGNQVWEKKLLDLYERILITETNLVIASHEPPKGINFFLPDLASRYSMSVVHQLEILSEIEIMSAIHMHAEIRGFNLSNESANYLLKRVERSVGSLVEIINILDYESLSKQRKLTIPFIKNILHFGQNDQ